VPYGAKPNSFTVEPKMATTFRWRAQRDVHEPGIVRHNHVAELHRRGQLPTRRTLPKNLQLHFPNALRLMSETIALQSVFVVLAAKYQIFA